MIVAKMHKQGNEALLAACDSELLDKTLEGDGELKVRISKNFYGEDSVTNDEFKIMLYQATTANLFGKETVTCAVKAGFLENDGIMHICGIPHAQLFIML